VRGGMNGREERGGVTSGGGEGSVKWKVGEFVMEGKREGWR
jgi:hypothetical protein